MTNFGRILDTTGGNFVAGPPMAIEAPVPINTYPELNLDGMPNLIERPMFDPGVIDQPPQHGHWTNAATGGCLPICAAEVPPGMPRQVLWTYLFHGHNPNMGINIVNGANNVNHVYVAFLLYALRNGVWGNYDFIGKGEFFQALDPNNQIPNANCLLIYGDFASLGMTPNAHIGVLPGNLQPTPPVHGGGGGGGSKCCCKCFITTAVCAERRLPDDCEELQVLRWYRDTVLRASATGQRDIDEYYTIAPAIVEAIDRRPDRRQVYARLYRRYIRPAVTAVKRGATSVAYGLYREMVYSARRYLGSTEQKG